MWFKKDVTKRYLWVFKLRNLEISHKDTATRDVHVGCIIYSRNLFIALLEYHNMSWRGLAALLILGREAMRRPEDWDKRKVQTPTSFLYI